MMMSITRSLSLGSVIFLHVAVLLLTTTAASASADDGGYTNGEVKYDESNGEVKYDEYPMVVPKRGALVLDRILVALNRALKDKHEGARSATRISDSHSGGAMTLPLRVAHHPSSADIPIDSYADEPMDLQRRGHSAGVAPAAVSSGTFVPRLRVWRCYFNAVTCF